VLELKFLSFGWRKCVWCFQYTYSRHTKYDVLFFFNPGSGGVVRVYTYHSFFLFLEPTCGVVGSIWPKKIIFPHALDKENKTYFFTYKQNIYIEDGQNTYTYIWKKKMENYYNTPHIMHAPKLRVVMTTRCSIYGLFFCLHKTYSQRPWHNFVWWYRCIQLHICIYTSIIEDPRQLKQKRNHQRVVMTKKKRDFIVYSSAHR